MITPADRIRSHLTEDERRWRRHFVRWSKFTEPKIDPMLRCFALAVTKVVQTQCKHRLMVPTNSEGHRRGVPEMCAVCNLPDYRVREARARGES